MQRSLRTLAAATILAALCAGCPTRTTTVERTRETTRSEPGMAAPPPEPPTVQEESTTIKRDHTRTEETR